MNSQVFSKTHARKMQKLKTKNRAKNLKEIKNDSNLLTLVEDDEDYYNMSSSRNILTPS